jgi:hypothetical protein
MATKTKAIDAPEHLQSPTREWYAWVASEYSLEPHHLRLLILAAEAWDRCVHAL